MEDLLLRFSLKILTCEGVVLAEETYKDLKWFLQQKEL